MQTSVPSGLCEFQYSTFPGLHNSATALKPIAHLPIEEPYRHQNKSEERNAH